MLTALRCATGDKELASLASKNDRPFRCPKCASAVVLKKGSKKIHHFAHAPDAMCAYGSGETELHRQCKTAVYEAMRANPRCEAWELERDLGDIVPDVSGDIDGVSVAVELQRSDLSVGDLYRRTAAYARLGLPVLWIVLPTKELDEYDRYAPSAWEKWLHAAYLGRVYYWQSGSTVLPYHFDDHEIWVEEKSYYVKGGGGEVATSGGYSYRSKRYRDLSPGSPVDIGDMRPLRSSGWQSDTVNIPSRYLLMGQQKKWW
jgi:competence protein CoiA